LGGRGPVSTPGNRVGRDFQHDRLYVGCGRQGGEEQKAAKLGGRKKNVECQQVKNKSVNQTPAFGKRGDKRDKKGGLRTTPIV